MHKILRRLGTWCRYRISRDVQIPAFCDATFSRCLHKRARTNQKDSHRYSDMDDSWQTKEELVQDLERSVIYEDGDILAINKPNGLPMQALKYSEHLPLHIPPPVAAELSIAVCLPDLAERLAIPALKPMYSQHRLYSGVIILSKNEDTEKRLKKYFRHTRAQKVFHQHYWALTVGLPKDDAADCELGLRRQLINDWLLSIAEPKVTKKAREVGKVVRFQMKHSVIDSNNRYDCALLNLQPTGTKWDFLEVYLTQQLCAVLGDHVYSARVRTVMGKPVLMHPQSGFPAPQVLPDYLMNALGLSKKNLENIPTHVHCHQLDLPVKKGKRNVIESITAPLPKFFSETLRCLDLTVPAVNKKA